MNERFEQAEQFEKRELSELMERDTAQETRYNEYVRAGIEAGIGKNRDMQQYYEHKCEEMIGQKAAQLERLDLTDAERDALIARYNEYSGEWLSKGNGALSKYYTEAARPLKEAQNRERKESWENKGKEYAREAAERQKQMQLDNIKRRTPNYGTPTTEEGWRHQAEVEFRQRGESWYYNVCMTEAAKCHVDEALKGR